MLNDAGKWIIIISLKYLMHKTLWNDVQWTTTVKREKKNDNSQLRFFFLSLKLIGAREIWREKATFAQVHVAFNISISPVFAII